MLLPLALRACKNLRHLRFDGFVHGGLEECLAELSTPLVSLRIRRLQVTARTLLEWMNSKGMMHGLRQLRELVLDGLGDIEMKQDLAEDTEEINSLCEKRGIKPVLSETNCVEQN